MDQITDRRSVLRWTALAAATAMLSACHAHWHVPPGQIKKQHTPAATGTAPGQKKKQ